MRLSLNRACDLLREWNGGADTLSRSMIWPTEADGEINLSRAPQLARNTIEELRQQLADAERRITELNTQVMRAGTYYGWSVDWWFAAYTESVARLRTAEHERDDARTHLAAIHAVPGEAPGSDDGTLVEAVRVRLTKLREKLAAPIPMLLHCPECGRQHVDAPEPEKGWTNPPHKSHLCHGCGTIWRPADVATNGVATIRSLGLADTWTVDHLNCSHQLAAVTASFEDVRTQLADAERQIAKLTPR